MSFGNDPWSDRIAKANEDGPRRALLAEIGIWRAGRLTDIAASRQATYALSRLYWLLRDREAAEREAKQLLSLCQTPPRASDEDIEAAKGWLASLGSKVPKIAPAPRERTERPDRPRRERPERSERGERPERSERGERPERPARADRPARTGDRGERPDRPERGDRPPRAERPERSRAERPEGEDLFARAIVEGDAGRFDDGLNTLRGKQGGRPDLIRVWLHLGRALAQDDAAALRKDVERLVERLRGQLGGPSALDLPLDAAPKKKATKAAPAPSTDVDALLGGEARGPSPREQAKDRSDALRAALSGDAAPAVEAVVPLLDGWGRLWRAIAAAERWDLPHHAMALLLRAVDKAAPDGLSIPGGTSVLVRMAASGSPLAHELLAEDGLRARYGGEGLDVVLALAEAAAADGWQVDRVLRGPTRKEAERHPALDTLGDAMDPLWRLLLKRGESRAELWYAQSLPPEGRAGVPMLLLEDHPRVVVLPIDADLLGWYGTLGGPEAIGWTGAEAQAVRDALAALGAPSA